MSGLTRSLLGHRELRAHDQREDAGQHEEHQRRADVEQADVGVVDHGRKAPALAAVSQMRSRASTCSRRRVVERRRCSGLGHRFNAQTGEEPRLHRVSPAERSGSRHQVAGLDVLRIGDPRGERGCPSCGGTGADRAAGHPRGSGQGRACPSPRCRAPCGSAAACARNTLAAAREEWTSRGRFTAGAAWPREPGAVLGFRHGDDVEAPSRRAARRRTPRTGRGNTPALVA